MSSYGNLAWEIKHLPGLSEFQKHLESQVVPAWLRKVTVHHTWKPTVAQWRGHASMHSLGVMYGTHRDYRWSAGPHFFVGPDGIWQGTPPTIRGIHAGSCNSHSLGFEIVGDYDLVQWAEPIRSLAFGALAITLRWAGRSIETDINFHRDCMPGQKSCPGSAISLGWVKRGVLEAMERLYQDRIVIGTKPSITLDQWIRALDRNGAGKVLYLTTGGERIYRFLSDLDIDPAFFLAMWVQVGGRPLESSGIQQLTRNPLELFSNGSRDIAVWSSFQIGAFVNILWLKEQCGAKGLQSVRQVVAKWFEGRQDKEMTIDGTSKAILEHMAYMAKS